MNGTQGIHLVTFLDRLKRQVLCLRLEERRESGPMSALLFCSDTQDSAYSVERDHVFASIEYDSC